MCIYIGDIGDNWFERKNINLYRIEEPNVFENTSLITNDWDVVHYKYPDKQIFNAESILIDSLTR